MTRAPVFKDTVAIFAWFAVLMGMAILARVPLGHMADPTDLSYVARPEWYFLFLFQFFKWFEGPLKVLGAVILPMLAIVALILVPFIDRGKMKSVRRRWGAIGLAALAAIFWGGLTARAVVTTPESHEMDMSLVQPWQEISAGNLASIGFFRKAQCGSCHALGKSGAGPGFALRPSPRRPVGLEEHITKVEIRRGRWRTGSKRCWAGLRCRAQRPSSRRLAERSAERSGGRADLPGQRLRELPQAERRRRRTGSGAQRCGRAPRPFLDRAAFRRSAEVFARLHHAPIPVQAR